MTISSLASPTGFGAGIESGELDSAGKFDPLSTHNLEYHENPVIVQIPKFGETRILFSARRISKGPYNLGQARFIFLSDTDITTRGGVAKFIANYTQVSSQLASRAASENLSVRTFGASDRGTYLLIGQADGYRVLDSKTLKLLGVLNVGNAALNVNPELREADMIFSVGTFNGTSFSSKIYSVGTGASGSVRTLTPIVTTSNLRRPLVSISSKAGESFAALDTANRVVVVSPLTPQTATKSAIAALPTKGRLSSSAAFWRDLTGSLHAAIVFENFVAQSGGISTRYKIEQVFVRALTVDESKLQAYAAAPDYDYPLESRQTVEMGIGSGMRPGVRDMRATSDGAAVFGLFPGSLSTQLYRLTAAGLIRVSQDSCTDFSIGREP